MPIYEYKCHGCGTIFDRIQKFADDPLTIHDDCGGALERLISAPAFHLKGSGWYATDYAKGGGDKDKKAADSANSSSSESKSSESKADSKADSKSDSKSETRTESKAESKPAATESKPAATTTSSDSK